MRSNQPIIKKISPEYSLEGLMLKLKLQYFSHRCEELNHLKRPWFEERLKVGRERNDREWDDWMASPAQWTRIWVNSGSWWWTGSLACYSPWGSKESDTTEWLNWTELILHIRKHTSTHLLTLNNAACRVTGRHIFCQNAFHLEIKSAMIMQFIWLGFLQWTICSVVNDSWPFLD